MMTDTHIHTHMPTLEHTCAQTHSHTSGRFFSSTPRSASWHTHTHTSSYELEICLTMTHTPIPTFGCVAKHIFLFHVYRRVSLARVRRYTQLAYLLHQCATSLLSRDCCIASCTVRHPGVEHPFSSFNCKRMILIVHFDKIQATDSCACFSVVTGLNANEWLFLNFITW